MYCPHCGTNITVSVRFCPRCGAPLPDASRRRRTTSMPSIPYSSPNSPNSPTAPRRRRPLRVLPIALAIAAALLVVVGVLVALRMLRDDASTMPWERSESDPYYTAEGYLLCGIRLSADRTHAYVGDEDGSVTLTLAVPEYVTESSVRIVDMEGEEVASIEVEDMDDAGDGWHTTELGFAMDTSEDGVTGLRAMAGQYYSPELDFYVTPHITADQVADSAVIGMECNEAMREDHADDTDEERARAAQEWLEADERVASTYLEEDGTTVWYATTDCVGGAYEAKRRTELSSPADDMSGVSDGSSKNLESTGPVADLYKTTVVSQADAGKTDYYNATKDSSVATNLDCLVLVPCSKDMGDNSEVYIEVLKMPHIAKDASLAASHSKIKEDGDAVKAILNKDLVNYGWITLFTHGGYNAGARHVGRRGRPKTNIRPQSFYLMYQSEQFESKTKKDVHASAQEKLSQFCDMDYAADTRGKSRDDFYAEWYVDTNGSSLGGVGKMFMSTDYSEKTDTYSIWMTSSFLESRYQDLLFDNTCIYIATCKGLSDRGFDEWLLNKGCSCLFGFITDVNTAVNVSYQDLLLSAMTEDSESHPCHRKTVSEAISTVGVPDSASTFAGVLQKYVRESHTTIDPQMWNLSRENQTQRQGVEVKNEPSFTTIRSVTEPLDYSVPKHCYDNTLRYMGSTDFCLAGKGSLTGRVVWQDVDEDDDPLPGTEPEPADGALVRAHYLSKRKFDPLTDKETTAASDGSFTMPELPMGHLVLTAEADNTQSDPYQLYLVDDEWDGGDIVIKRHKPTVYVHVKDSSGSVVHKATVVFVGEDGTSYEATLIDPPEGKMFMAGVTAQHYELRVTPDDKDLAAATVQLDIPDSEPWSHDVDVVLEDVCDISGSVADAQTYAQLENVEVRWEGPSGDGFAQTASDGSYKAEDLAAGDYTLTFKKTGYQTQSLAITARRGDNPVEQVLLEPEPVAMGTALSSCIGAYQGTTYSIEPVANTLTLLPTTCARYDYICSFTFYGDKVYYCCKEAGTAAYRMALYEANLDGSEARELYAPTEPMGMSPGFAIRDGVLYHRAYSSTAGVSEPIPFAIELDTGSRYEADAVPEDVREFLYTNTIRYGDKKVHEGELANDFTTDCICVTHADGSTETFVSVSTWVDLEAVVPIEGEDDAYVYYSAYSGQRSYELYRKRLSGGESELLGSRPAAGGGGYFAW